MEKILPTAVEKLIEKATETGIKMGAQVPPIILKRFFRNYPEIYLTFALVFDFYELPMLDDAVQLVESSLAGYKDKNDASTLQIDGSKFTYFINYEVEEDYSPPDIDTIKEPELILSSEYISLMEILLFPKNDKNKIESKEQVEKLVISGVKLRDAIIDQLKKDEKANCVLKIRSDNLMAVLESDYFYVSKIYERLFGELQKSKTSRRPYIEVSPYNVNNRSKIIISINDSATAQLLIRSLP
jgi:hypothetical protein